jgi:hypothetical protein
LRPAQVGAGTAAKLSAGTHNTIEATVVTVDERVMVVTVDERVKEAVFSKRFRNVFRNGLLIVVL